MATLWILGPSLTLLRRHLGLALVLPLLSALVLALLLRFAVAPVLVLVLIPLRGFPTLAALLLGLSGAAAGALLVTAVGLPWHRRLLLGKRAWSLGAFRRREALAYFLRAFALVVGARLAAVALFSRPGGFPLMAPLVSPLGDEGRGYVGLALVAWLLWTAITWLALRLGLVLPAAAAGGSMGPRRSWVATSPAAGRLVAPAALCVLAPAVQWAMPWFALLVGLGARALILPTLVVAVLSWLALMLGLTALATLHGRAAEPAPG